jgi:hypothetical protein
MRSEDITLLLKHERKTNNTLFIAGKMILNLTATKYHTKMRTGFILLKIACSYGLGTEPPDSIKGIEFFKSAAVSFPTRTVSWH